MASQKEEEAQKVSLLISSLPRAVSWSKEENFALYQYQSFWYPSPFLEGVLRAQELDSSDEINISPSHVVLCSIPKSGTTWLKALAFCIMTRTRFNLNSQDHPLLSTFPHDLVPYLEWFHKRPLTEDSYSFPLLSTHMPYSALPGSIFGSSTCSNGCKIVYICRNPKDVLVSYWHFLMKIRTQEFVVTLEKTFDHFIHGISMFGPYWDHVLEYWKASLDNPTKVLFIKYEEMMEDGLSHVRRLAEFMGYPFSEEEERDNLIAMIVEMCSFESLSNMDVNKHKFLSIISEDDADNKVSTSVFFRNAKMGDWRNYLSKEMASKLDDISFEKFNKFGLIM